MGGSKIDAGGEGSGATNRPKPLPDKRFREKNYSNGGTLLRYDSRPSKGGYKTFSRQATKWPSISQDPAWIQGLLLPLPRRQVTTKYPPSHLVNLSPPPAPTPRPPPTTHKPTSKLIQGEWGLASLNLSKSIKPMENQEIFLNGTQIPL